MIEVVGLDLSLSGTGVSDSIGARTIKTPSRVTRAGGAFRLHWLVRELRREVSRTTQLAVIEDYVPNPTHGTGHMGNVEWGGIVRLWLYRHDIQYVLVHPSTLKVFATGNGKAKKIDVIHAARAHGAVVGDDNAADAWWLRQMALAHYELPGAITSPDHKSLQTVTWPAINEMEGV